MATSLSSTGRTTLAPKSSRRNFLLLAGSVAILVPVMAVVGLDGGLGKLIGESIAPTPNSFSSSTSSLASGGTTTALSSADTAASTSSATSSQTLIETTAASNSQVTSQSEISSTTSSEESSSLQSSTTTGTSTTSAAALSIGNVNDLQILSPVYFEYPEAGYPNVLFKKADGTVVALSLLCTHLCCTAKFQSSDGEIDCPCHGSKFDNSGNVLNGPATQPLPQVNLTIDSSGNIFPNGISGSSPCLP